MLLAKSIIVTDFFIYDGLGDSSHIYYGGLNITIYIGLYAFSTNFNMVHFMTDISVIRVKQDAFDRTVEDKTVEGWTIKTKGDRVAILEKRGGWGSIGWHILIAILTAWWTVFIGNIIYAVYSHFYSGKELQIKVEDVV